MSILPKIISKARENFAIIICGFIFSLLLLRNPFSMRTQIANFAPAPDAFYYVVPARSLIQGTGPLMVREGRFFSPVVPPLYTFALAPIFVLNQDPRMFYFVNVILAFSSFILFLILIKQLFPSNRWLQLLLLFLFSTNSILYWFPTLAMAENLALPLFLSCLILLTGKQTLRRAALLGVLAVLAYATKYANLPLMVGLIVLYGLKLLHPIKTFKSRSSSLLILLFASSLTFLVFGSYEILILGHDNFFNPVRMVISPLLTRPNVSGSSNLSSDNQWFSLSYVRTNLPFYFRMLLGSPTIILWEVRSILAPILAVFAMIGLVLTLVSKKRFFVSLSLIVLLTAQIGFMSTFYAPDGRYVMAAIPIMILALGLFCDWLTRRRKLGGFVTWMFLLLALILAAPQLKKDVMLNLKYAETPWWYIAVLELNKTIEVQLPLLSREKLNKEPVVITPLYPYLVDFFSSGKYKLLPLSPEQEFRSNKAEVWGNYDYSDMDRLYSTFLQQGYPLYVASYGIGHEQVLISAFDHLQKAFRLEEISSACHDLCKVYRVLPQINLEKLKGSK